ncbi:ATP-dependent DNA ligase [Bradyrhizobium japonicum]|uniref:DNA ligase (ATP) n=1 Tax=Bradyrhizobium japonicum TaxID=375 RepID=A0ABV2RH36_BRAJP|nr:ATP-dependent DNA ligase [Bradyrhizobium japonicum]MCP1821316.1 ATP-dependent DNA ligase [Bradyrhizobium japonicum]MCP1876351.1 ATP-dependent DNA ligase [Bradyrhizobium japonicum]MCP1943759.1 ATP-dependent DNA ligase [Bradyrhizobium japonicum]
MLVAFDLLYLNGRDLWVEPKLLAEIEYQAKSAEGKVRHPFFKGCEDL